MKRHPALFLVALVTALHTAFTRSREPRCPRCGCSRSRPCTVAWDGGTGVCADLSTFGIPTCSNCTTGETK